jgi:hypothetical protein
VLFILNWIDAVIAILAIIFSAIAFSQARRTPGGRKGMALSGLILGGIGLVASIATLIFVVGFVKDAAQRCEDHIGHPPTSAELRQCARDGI